MWFELAIIKSHSFKIPGKKTKTKNSEKERERSENVKNTLLMTNY